MGCVVDAIRFYSLNEYPIEFHVQIEQKPNIEIKMCFNAKIVCGGWDLANKFHGSTLSMIYQ